MKVVTCWLICSNRDEQLPCACFDTLREACEWLGIPLDTAKSAFKRHGKYFGKEFNIERVQIHY